MRITLVGLGTWAIGGGGWAFAWGPQEDKKSIKTIHRAGELGINWIDTAPVYGTGHSEEVVAQALDKVDPRPYVFTKVSMIWDNNRKVSSSQRPESIRSEVKASLKRLRVDKIDLCQVHWPEPEDEIEEGWRTLAELKDEGVLRHIGVSNFSVEQMEKVGAIAPVETLQPPYSLVYPEVEKEILPYAKQHGIGVIAYSPMASGLLSGTMTAERIRKMPSDDWRKRSKEFKEPRLSRNLALAGLLGEIGNEHGCSAGEVAIAWTLVNPAITAAIVGGRSPEQVDGFVGAATLKLGRSDLERITSFLREHP
jgi:aryl-alcohol dehydrogenase-like predicted oxidoreductase